MQGVQEDTKTTMKAEDLVDILKGDDERKEKDVAQSGIISEEVRGDSLELPSGGHLMITSHAEIHICNHFEQGRLMTVPATHCR